MPSMLSRTTTRRQHSGTGGLGKWSLSRRRWRRGSLSEDVPALPAAAAPSPGNDRTTATFSSVLPGKRNRHQRAQLRSRWQNSEATGSDGVTSSSCDAQSDDATPLVISSDQLERLAQRPFTLGERINRWCRTARFDMLPTAPLLPPQTPRHYIPGIHAAPHPWALAAAASNSTTV